MLFVSITQFVAVAFTITALWKNTLMLSPEQNGVTCNITSRYFPKKNITAKNLAVYWGWSTLEVRWDFEGLTDTQIWLKETYEKTYDYRCKNSSTNITHMPTPAPILHPKTPSPKPTKSPTLNATIYNNIQYNYNERRLIDDVDKCEEFNDEIPLPMGYTKYYPFEITNTFYNEYNLNNNEEYIVNINNETQKEGCDDLQIVIETGKSYFSLLVCGLFFECVGLILLIPPTCHLVNVKTRRLLKQIVIGLNTVSFMLLLMAFAIWFAYFSTNINQVIEQEGGKNFSVCILGEPIFGDSIAYVLTGWLLIGLATMSTCYLSNRPKRWYRFLRKKRHFNLNNKQIQELNNEEMILEEEEDDSQSQTDESTSSSSSNANQNHLLDRTPSDNSDGYTESFMTAESGSFGNVVMKGDTYPYTYSPN